MPQTSDTTVEELARELDETRIEVTLANVQAEKYRKAAEHLALEYARTKLEFERERSALIDDHDAFIVELIREHDRIIADLATDRDEPRDGTLEGEVAKRDLARVTQQLNEAKREIGRLRQELEQMALINEAVKSRRPSRIPMPAGKPRSEEPTSDAPVTVRSAPPLDAVSHTPEVTESTDDVAAAVGAESSP